MRISNWKAIIAETMMVAVAAGAFALANPMKADAEQFAVGVQFGAPYGPAAYYGDRDFDARRDFDRRDFDARRDAYQFEQRQAYLRHEEWERSQHIERHEDREDFDRDRRFRGDDRDWR